jgi:hypothetical protein
MRPSRDPKFARVESAALATATPKFALNIIAHEFKEDIETYLATMQSTEVRNLQDIIE